MIFQHFTTEAFGLTIINMGFISADIGEEVSSE